MMTIMNKKTERARVAGAILRYAARRRGTISASRLLAAWRRNRPSIDAKRSKIDGRVDALAYGTAVHIALERSAKDQAEHAARACLRQRAKHIDFSIMR